MDLLPPFWRRESAFWGQPGHLDDHVAAAFHGSREPTSLWRTAKLSCQETRTEGNSHPELVGAGLCSQTHSWVESPCMVTSLPCDTGNILASLGCHTTSSCVHSTPPQAPQTYVLLECTIHSFHPNNPKSINSTQHYL